MSGRIWRLNVRVNRIVARIHPSGPDWVRVLNATERHCLNTESPDGQTNRLYLDTNIISAYWYSGADIDGLARRSKTREWWKNERDHFSVWASAASEDELAAGKFRRQAECLRFVRRLPYLPISGETKQFARRLVELGVVPAEKPGDALQMAACAAHRIDYLLSWNYAHLVNPVAQTRLETVCSRLSLRAPLLVSPESIPKASLGQTIRRRES